MKRSCEELIASFRKREEELQQQIEASRVTAEDVLRREEQLKDQASDLAARLAAAEAGKVAVPTTTSVLAGHVNLPSPNAPATKRKTEDLSPHDGQGMCRVLCCM